MQYNRNIVRDSESNNDCYSVMLLVGMVNNINGSVYQAECVRFEAFSHDVADVAVRKNG